MVLPRGGRQVMKGTTKRREAGHEWYYQEEGGRS